jgi:hypothetical protein
MSSAPTGSRGRYAFELQSPARRVRSQTGDGAWIAAAGRVRCPGQWRCKTFERADARGMYDEEPAPPCFGSDPS